MSFLRFVCRSMLASYFVADGLKAALDPEPLVADAEPTALKATEYVERFLPPDVARFVPTTTQGLVRIHGIVQAVGGLLMATGVFRRLGALILAAAYAPKAISAGRSLNPFNILRDVSLLGGVLIEAGDTQGKPHLGWMLAYKQQQAAQARSAHKKQAKNVDRRTIALRDLFSSSDSK